MAVRYRPRGLDLYPGRRVAYVFENEVTRAKGIPTKTTLGTVHGIHRDQRGNAHARVSFDNAPLVNGHPYVATVPVEHLSDPDNPQVATQPEDYYRRVRILGPGAERRARMAWWDQSVQDRKDGVPYGINGDLWRRAVARYGDHQWWRGPHQRRMAQYQAPTTEDVVRT